MAGGAGGYGYRLGSARPLTIGWVGAARPPREGPALWRRLGSAAGWLLTGLPVPVTADAGAAVPIGDAALTRDALASHGPAIESLRTCRHADRPAWAAYRRWLAQLTAAGGDGAREGSDPTLPARPA